MVLLLCLYVLLCTRRLGKVSGREGETPVGREREGEREGERKGGRERKREGERERRERERERNKDEKIILYIKKKRDGKI